MYKRQLPQERDGLVNGGGRLRPEKTDVDGVAPQGKHSSLLLMVVRRCCAAPLARGGAAPSGMRGEMCIRDRCRSLGLPLTLSMLGRGTAMRAHLDLYGLEATQKAVVATVADGQNARRLFREAKRQLYLDIPGNGIMLALPIKSVGGGKTLACLLYTSPVIPDNRRC